MNGQKHFFLGFAEGTVICSLNLGAGSLLGQELMKVLNLAGQGTCK